jgi:hypothetical protein
MLKSFDMKNYRCLIILIFIAFISCEKIQPDFADYMDTFEIKGPGIVPNELIAMDDVAGYVVGHGWEAVEICQFDSGKNVVKTDNVVDDIQRDCFEVKGFGNDQLLNYGLKYERYGIEEFSYDESTNSISLAACWHNAKLVYLTDDVMVCVDHEDWYRIFVFRKVKPSVLKQWRKMCPDLEPRY